MYILGMYRMFFRMDFAEMPQNLLQCAMYMYTRTYCTFHLAKFYSTQRSEPSESLISLWQQNENGAAAQPLIGKKRHTQVQNCGCVKHVKQATSVLPSGQRVERLKTKGKKFQYQPVDLGVRHGMSFFVLFLSLVLLTYPSKKKKKPCFTKEIGRHMREFDLEEVKLSDKVLLK